MSAFRVVIPARMASTRLPGKPLADIAGVPMVVRVAERAGRSGADEVWVATDDERILAVCAEHGVDAVMTRADHVSGTDRIAEVAEMQGWQEDDLVVNVQGDEPLLDPTVIALVAAELGRRPDLPMATVAYPLTRLEEMLDPSVVKVVVGGRGQALYFSRAPIPWARGALPETLPAGHPALRHVGLYAYRVGFLQDYADLAPSPLELAESLEQLRVLWHGYSIAVAVADGVPCIGVDTPEDLERVRALF